MPLRNTALAAGIAISLLVSACAQRNNPKGSVTHVVICYLKQPGDSAARQKIIDASKQFRGIPGVLGVEAGKVLPSTRPIVVSDYDVGVVITFKDAQAMEDYGKHPMHQKALREVLGPLTSKVVAYDFVNE
jgi:hypothetical protein